MIASTGIQVHGGVGYVEETGAAQFLRDARITTIYEGTTGIQPNDLIGRKLVRDNGRNAAALVRDMQAEVAALGVSNDPSLAAIRSGLNTALQVFEEATAWMLTHYEAHPRQAAAGAVPYLKLAGSISGGWQMARAARIAHDLLASRGETAAFLRAKISTARFYAEHVLPETGAWLDEITMGAASTLALEEALFQAV